MENLLGKRDQMGELERGEGGGRATLGVGCSKGNGKRGLTRGRDVEMEMTESEEGRQSRKARI